MKEIYNELRLHLKADFQKHAYLYLVVFVFSCLIINYSFDLEGKWLSANFGKPEGYLYYCLVYAFAYYGAMVPVLLFKQQAKKLTQPEFWVKSLVFILLIGFFSGFGEYRTWSKSIGDTSHEVYYLNKIFGNLKRFIPYLLVLLCIKWIYDKQDNHLYGLRFKGLHYKPYLLILLIMLPIITAASFLPDFQAYYPNYKFWKYNIVFGLNQWQAGLGFEIAYGLDFVSTELIYRGALVIGMYKVLGKEAVLGMVALYTFIHFGKPLGEAISSFFGGYILGVVALNHKNIYGGIIVHLGVAYLMEITVILQHYL